MLTIIQDVNAEGVCFISSQHVTTISSWSMLNAVEFFLPELVKKFSAFD
jgi:hypothetical protein